jgi:hypothetical protein
VVSAMHDPLTPDSLLLADAGSHSEANLRALAALGVDALIADNDMRRRDERFTTQERHRQAPHPFRQPAPSEEAPALYQPRDFTYDPEARTCACPAGKRLYRAGRDVVINRNVADRFRGTKRDCVPCAHRARCLRTPATTAVRQVAFLRGKAPAPPESRTARMKRRLDSPEGRARYGARFGTVEPVFGNLRTNKALPAGSPDAPRDVLGDDDARTRAPARPASLGPARAWGGHQGAVVRSEAPRRRPPPSRGLRASRDTDQDR